MSETTDQNVGQPTPPAPSNGSADQQDIHSLDRVMDIPLVVSVELGRTKMLIGELLQLEEGSILELSKLAGEPLDVLVHGKLVARGEAVVVNDKFGVRLTDIVSPSERIQSLAD